MELIAYFGLGWIVLSMAIVCESKRIVTTPRDGALKLKKGESDTLKCEITGRCDWPDCKKFIWKKMGNSTILAKGEEYKLEDVTCNDAGEYTCYSEIVWVENNGTTISVEIEDVCLKTTPQNINVDLKVGEDLNLECQLTGCKSDGCDNLEANWWKEEDDTPPHHGKTYTKESVSLVDAGEYTCVIQYKNEPYEGKFSVHIEDISMEKYPKELQVNMTKGSSLVLYCQLRGCPREGCGHYTISWTKPEDVRQLSGKSNFTLKNVRYGDSGVYTCKTVVKGEPFEEVFDVFVEGDLHIKTKPEVRIVNVAHGTNELLLECELIGCSRQGCTYIHFTWEKGGTQIAEGKSFHREKATYNDTATYMCKTEYAGQWYNNSFQVQVYGKPDGRPVITPHNLVSVVLVNIELTCNISGIHSGVPAGDKYQWFKNTKIQSGENKQHYSFTPQNVTNREAFACALQNKHGSSPIGTTNISVEAPPFIESPATNRTYRPRYDFKYFNMSFIISGSNLTNFTVKNSNGELVDEDFTIHHEPVYGHHKYGQTEAKKVTLKWILDAIHFRSCDGITRYNGHYKIEAMGTAANLTYRDNSTFNIQVQYPAIWRKLFQNETSQRCVPKTLYCDVCAEPAPTKYSWSFMGEELGNTTGPRLNLTYVSKEEFGIYTCTVQNNIGTKSFNITMVEDGFVYHPEKLTTVSRTSKTLVLSWEAKRKECYDPEKFELFFSNDTLVENIAYKGKHCELEKCNYRITSLHPQTKYGFKMRAKYDWSDDDRSYSPFVTAEGTTPALPNFKPLDPTITSTSIEIQWEYADKQVYITGQDDDVTVVIYYKRKGESNFAIFPEDGRIPAEKKSAIIPGEFETLVPYIFKYLVFEGDQQAVETEPKESLPDDNDPSKKPGNVGAIIGASVGAVLFIALASVLVMGLIYHRKKGSKPASKTDMSETQDRSSPSTQNKPEKKRGRPTPYENMGLTQFPGSAPDYEEIPAGEKSDIANRDGMYVNVDTHDTPMKPQDNKDGPELAYADLVFDGEVPEMDVQQIHGAENSVDYVELDHDNAKTGRKKV